jgi:hypothetical protein
MIFRLIYRTSHGRRSDHEIAMGAATNGRHGNESMPVRAYRSQSYQTTHENRAFDTLLGALESVWGESEETVVLLGNLYCHGTEIDAAIIRQRSITVLDFKDYGGKILFSENGSWLADDVEVKGGSKRNPYHQVRTNKFAFLEFIQNLASLPSGRSPNLGHISGMVLFQRPISFDEGQLPGPISRWFHVVDMDHATRRISNLTSREIDLTDGDIETLVRSTGLGDYRPVGSGIRLEAPDPDTETSLGRELPQPLNHSWSRITAFLSGQEPVAIVAGMIGTGKRLLLKRLVLEAQLSARNLTVLCPNRRLAERCSVEAESIYGHIYSGNPHLRNGQLIYDRLDNKDDPRHLYVVDNAHLISDSLFETEVLRFGSGQLLTDFIQYLEIGEPRRQVVFLGDPYQLGRGNFEECALSFSRLNALMGSEPVAIELDRVLPGNDTDIFTRNCIALANSIRLQKFNEMEILTNEDSCVEAPVVDQEKRALFESSTAPKFIAFSHAQVNQFNEWIRRTIHGRQERLSSGDVVHIHNGFFIYDDDGVEYPYLVQNDCFAEILEVDNNPEILRQKLRGRDNPVEVSFLKVRARFQHDGKVKRFLCLQDYLLSEKPEIDPEALLALRVSAATRSKRKYEGRTANDAAASDEPDDLDINEGLETDRLAAFMRSDPYLNAARMRFGYGLTLHRAQGQSFPDVLANLDTGQGQTNETYFRWLYTLFTIPEKRLFLANIPKLSPFMQARWDESRSRLDNVNLDELIRYDPNAALLPSDTSEFDFPTQELSVLHRHIAVALSEIDFSIIGIEHHQYQEVYEIKGSDGSHCRLRLHYKKGFKISRIEVIDPSTPDVDDRIRNSLMPNIVFEEEFQERIYQEVRTRLSTNAIEVRGVDHGAFKDLYFLECVVGRAKVEINYNKDGFVTLVSLSTYSDPRMKERVRQGLGF